MSQPSDPKPGDLPTSTGSSRPVSAPSGKGKPTPPQKPHRRNAPPPPPAARGPRVAIAAAAAVAIAVCVGVLVLSSKDDKKPDTLASVGSCTPSGTGTTDLKTKPVFTVPQDPAPTVTTIIDIVCGTGAEAKAGSAVTVKYVGVNYADGKEFDSSWKRGVDETLPFSIGGGVIEGFSKGTTGMKVGGRREVIVSPADGYGDSGPVPGGTLVFFIDLVTVS